MLRKRLFAQANVDEAIQQLKSSSLSKEEKLEKWDEVKILALTRLFAGIYAFVMMSLVLKIQLHILGRYAYRRKAAKSNDDIDDGDELGTEMQEQFAPFLSATVEYMLGDGLVKLVEHVKNTVENATIDWSVQNKLNVSVDELEELLTDIREDAECMDSTGDTTDRVDGDNEFPALLSFVRWPVEGAESKHKNVLQLLNETRDMIESPNFLEAVMDMADAAFPAVEEEVQSQVFLAPSASTAMVASGSLSPSLHQDMKPLPLANVIPRLNRVVAKVLPARVDDEPARRALARHFPTKESAVLLCDATFLQDEPDAALRNSILYGERPLKQVGGWPGVDE
jgi:hypothetical protein